jgi:WD40 repeat protein
MKSSLVLLILVLSIQTILAQRKFITTLEPTSGSTLYMYDGSTLRKIFEDPMRVFPNECIISSESGNLIGVRASKASRYTEGGQWYLPWDLLVFSDDGRLIVTIPRVQRYHWSPDGQHVACILGTQYESFGFAPDSLVIINATDWSRHTVSSKVDYQDIYWASFDSMIYATNYRNVYQINPKGGAIVKTNYRGIYFSPDGSYYFAGNYEGQTFGVYERTTNRDVTPQGYKANPAVNFHRWLPKGSTLVLGDTFKDKQVFDLVSKKVKTISGEMLGYNEHTKEFIVLKRHRYFPEVQDKKIEKIADK